MNTLARLEFWADHHHPKWIEYLRILLGFILILKGIVFIMNKDEVVAMITSGSETFTPLVISHYVIASYIAGGIAVAIGLFTRIAVITILPAVIGAIIYLDLHKHLFALNSEIVYSILILALLLFYLFYGSGILSVDNYLNKQQPE